jgi:peptidoglycan/xylan/chitin deacetylase (PgdA/CDA1 family)
VVAGAGRGVGEETRTFPLTTPEQKDAAFTAIYWWMRAQPEDKSRALVRRLAAEAGIDMAKQCRDQVMTWDEIRDLARDPLVTIGAHTRYHYALGRLMPDDARAEMVESIKRIEGELGARCAHFSYPYGCEISAGEREFELAAQLGITTAVTTRKGLLYCRDANRMTALPRLSLNGDFQDNRYVKVLLSGAPFALMRALRMQSA